MKENIKILVVDDDPDILLGTSRILETEGFEVIQADSASEAIAQATETLPDLILLDVVLNGSDKSSGFTVCRKLKKNPALINTFIMMVSGKKIAPDDQAEGLASGADGYMTRPFVKKEFLARLHSLVRIQQTQKQIQKNEHWLQTTLKSIGDGVIATDEKGGIIFMNPVAETITGWAMKSAVGKPCRDIFRIRNDQTGEPIDDPVDRVLNEGIVIGISNHTVLFRKDGTTRFIADSAAPIRDDTGSLTGVVLVFQDVTKEREKELAIDLAHKEWEDIFQAIGHPTIILDKDHGIIRANQAVLDLLQQPLEFLIGKRCYHIFHQTNGPPTGCPFETVSRSGNLEKQDMEMEALGRTFLVSCTPVFKEGEELKHIIHIATDITKRKQAELQIKKDFEERDIMLREIHHRVKNNLQIIISLLNLQLQHVKEKPTKGILQEIKNRIYSMAVVHEKLYEAQNFAEIHISDYIQLIVKEILYSYKRLEEIQTTFEIEDIVLGIEKAIPCGLIINEWMTNALKHAHPRGQEGRLHISLKNDKSGVNTLVFQDAGAGLPEYIDIANPESMGLKIVSVLANQLEAELAVERKAGTVYTLVFK